MKKEKLYIDYNGLAAVINELTKLYDMGDIQTKRVVDRILLLLGNTTPIPKVDEPDQIPPRPSKGPHMIKEKFRFW